MKLFAGHAAFREDGQELTRRTLAVQHDDVLLARDADDGTRHPRRTASHDRAVARWIGSGQWTFRSPRVNRDAFLFGELDGLGVQHFRARLGHFLRLFVGQRTDTLRAGYHAWIGRIHAID